MDEDFDFEELEDGWQEAARLRWWDFLPVALSLPVALLQAVTRWGEQVVVLLAGHASFKDEQARLRHSPISVTQ